jgi:hypothetical protein
MITEKILNDEGFWYIDKVNKIILLLDSKDNTIISHITVMLEVKQKLSDVIAKKLRDFIPSYNGYVYFPTELENKMDVDYYRLYFKNDTWPTDLTGKINRLLESLGITERTSIYFIAK